MPMTPTFLAAVEQVLIHEGGYVNDSTDPGGATNWGISLRYLKTIGDLDGDGYAEGDLDRDGDVDAEDVRRMTRAGAIDIYRRQWWDRYGYERLPVQVAGKAFNLAVNMGHVQMVRILQRAIGAAHVRIADDGIMGPVTIRTANEAHPRALLPALRSEAAGFYRVLISRVPAFVKYERGWLNRAYS